MGHMFSENRLADTTFATGADDDLIVADIYNQTTDSVVNSIQDEDAKLLADLEAAINEDIEEALRVPPYVPEPGDLTDEEALERLSGVSDEGSSLRNTLRQLSDGIKKGISIDANITKNVFAEVNGFKSLINIKSLPDIKKLTNVINTLTGGNFNTKFTDKGALSGLITGLTIEGSKLGIPNIYSSISKIVSNKDILLSSARNLIPRAIKTGNTDLIFDLANSSIQTDISRIIPNAVPSILGNFSFKNQLGLKLPQTQWPGEFTKLSGAFDNIDSTWKSLQRGNGKVLSGVCTAKSTEFMDMMEAKVYSQPGINLSGVGGLGFKIPPLVEDEKYLLLMKKFEVTSVKKELNTFLPSIKIDVNPSFTDHDASTYYDSNFDREKYNKSIDDMFDTTKPYNVVPGTFEET